MTQLNSLAGTKIQDVPYRGSGEAARAVVSNAVQGTFTFVTGAKVQVSISHPRASDLDLYLIGPNGQIVPLALQRGGNAADAYINTTFDDSAAQSIAGATAPFASSWW